MLPTSAACCIADPGIAARRWRASARFMFSLDSTVIGGRCRTRCSRRPLLLPPKIVYPRMENHPRGSWWKEPRPPAKKAEVSSNIGPMYIRLEPTGGGRSRRPGFAAGLTPDRGKGGTGAAPLAAGTPSIRVAPSRGVPHKKKPKLSPVPAARSRLVGAGHGGEEPVRRLTHRRLRRSAPIHTTLCRPDGVTPRRTSGRRRVRTSRPRTRLRGRSDRCLHRRSSSSPRPRGPPLRTPSTSWPGTLRAHHEWESSTGTGTMPCRLRGKRRARIGFGLRPTLSRRVAVASPPGYGEGGNCDCPLQVMRERFGKEPGGRGGLAWTGRPGT